MSSKWRISNLNIGSQTPELNLMGLSFSNYRKFTNACVSYSFSKDLSQIVKSSMCQALIQALEVDCK